MVNSNFASAFLWPAHVTTLQVLSVVIIEAEVSEEEASGNVGRKEF